MNDYRHILPSEFNENIFSLIGKRWMLVAAKKLDGSSNMMTASWGGAGVLWNKNVCFVFIRPTRFTYEFTESSDFITLSFFDEKYRSALKICGAVSGRNTDKAVKTGLSKIVDDKYVTFGEAEITIKAKKLYASFFEPDNFVDKSLLSLYHNDFHKMYVCEIEDITIKE